jgi:succinate-acetate transporter protein
VLLNIYTMSKSNQPFPVDNFSLLRKIRKMLFFFVIMLVLSGITAFPAETLLNFALRFSDLFPTRLEEFLSSAYQALHETNARFPFLAYGYDWLAFAHLVIAMAFIGPYREPVRNIWVIEWAMLACVAIFPLAMICGPIREIPIFWRIIDCSFGVLGIIPLWIVRNWIKELEVSMLND